ncbi:MAG: hypothetical protein AB1427_04760 [Thermodesulfobacteriota bacterium]
MSKTVTVVAAFMVAALAAGVTGCASLHITMNPEVSESELATKHIPYHIILVIDSELESYHWQGFSDAELRNVDYDLGSASKDLFLKAFMLASKGVTLVKSRPTYSDAGRNDIVLVVHPRIGGFSEKHSLWIRNADYLAEIIYHVTVYDKTGKVLLEKVYSSRGVAMGSTNLYSNYGAPVERAMEQAIVAIIDDINKLKAQ